MRRVTDPLLWTDVPTTPPTWLARLYGLLERGEIEAAKQGVLDIAHALEPDETKLPVRLRVADALRRRA